MSILIKGMKMPKSCMYCPLNYDCISCEVNYDVDFDFEGYDKERHKDCPLIEVPNPNINSNELIVGYQVMKKKNGIKYSFLENGLIRMTEVEE